MPLKRNWKDARANFKKSKRVKLALGILALAAGLIVLSQAVRFTQNFFSPWSLSAPSERKYHWNGEFNINLLVRTPSLSVLTYNPKEKRIIIINIPDETFLEIPRGFGMWQVRSVYGLGGDQLLKETLTSFLGLPVDGFLDFSALKPQKSALELVEIIRKNPFSGLKFLSDLKTDLTPWELMKLKLGFGNVRFDKVKQLDLAKLNVLDKETLPDGTAVLTADPVKLDSVLDSLADPAIAAEHRTIAVLNATERPQLAQTWARLITNLGGNVIITANASQKLKKTVATGEESLTLTRLRQIFGENDKISPSDEAQPSRAQISVLLGDDL